MVSYYAIDQNRDTLLARLLFIVTLSFQMGAVLNGAAFVVAMKIKSTNKRPEPRKRYYICDRTKCTNCTIECGHTTDLRYALYPEHDVWVMANDGSMWQKVRNV